MPLYSKDIQKYSLELQKHIKAYNNTCETIINIANLVYFDFDPEGQFFGLAPEEQIEYLCRSGKYPFNDETDAANFLQGKLQEGYNFGRRLARIGYDRSGLEIFLKLFSKAHDHLFKYLDLLRTPPKDHESQARDQETDAILISIEKYVKEINQKLKPENNEGKAQPEQGGAEVPDLSFIESSPDKIIMAELLQTKGDRGRFLVTPILDEGKFPVNNTKGVYRFLIGKKLNRDQIYLFFKRYMSGYKDGQTLDDYWNKLRKYIPR